MTKLEKPATVDSLTLASKAKASEPEPSGDASAPNGGAAAALAAYAPWARASHIALVGLFVIALLWCAYIAQSVIMPVLLAWVMATIVLPIVRWMAERGVPRVIAAIVVTLALVLVILSLLALLSTPLTFWLGRASELGALIRQKLQSMNQPLAILEEMRKVLATFGTDGGPSLKVEQSSATVVTTIFSVLTPAVGQFMLFMGALIFYLVYQTRLRNTAVLLFSDRATRLKTLRILSDVDEKMTRYFGAFTLVNFCLGIVTVFLTWAAGLPNPLLWGVLAAIFNYVPYIGPAIVVATLGVVSLLTFPTLGEAVVAPLIYTAIVTVEGYFLTPSLMGRQLDLNSFAVFLAIAFCTWLWGPIGAFLAVPLLMALTVAFGHALAEEEDEPQFPERTKTLAARFARETSFSFARSTEMAQGSTPYRTQEDKTRSSSDFKETTAKLAESTADQVGRIAGKVEGAASRVAEQGREAGQQVQQVAGNLKGAVDKSARDQPMATLALAAALGFVLGALWKK